MLEGRLEIDRRSAWVRRCRARTKIIGDRLRSQWCIAEAGMTKCTVLRMSVTRPSRRNMTLSSGRIVADEDAASVTAQAAPRVASRPYAACSRLGGGLCGWALSRGWGCCCRGTGIE
jgi:hypothetical protein